MFENIRDLKLQNIFTKTKKVHTTKNVFKFYN